jgi:hypothetical protein
MVKMIARQNRWFFHFANAIEPCSAAGINVDPSVFVIVKEKCTAASRVDYVRHSSSPIECVKSSPISRLISGSSHYLQGKPTICFVPAGSHYLTGIGNKDPGQVIKKKKLLVA